MANDKKGVFVRREVELPVLPNFLKAGENRINVSELSDEDIDVLGRKWTEALKAHAARRRLDVRVVR